MTSDNKISIIRANFELLSQIETDRIFTADRNCFIKDAEGCFDGIEAN
jgi:hypothetical protein